jgi:hypothetical protein
VTKSTFYGDGARAGDALAQYKVGYAGRYLRRPNALELLKKAAEQGQPDAQLELAAIYAEGLLREERGPTAAAEEGHRRAQQEDGFMLNNGTGVPVNEKAGGVSPTNRPPMARSAPSRNSSGGVIPSSPSTSSKVTPGSTSPPARITIRLPWA